MTDIRQALEKAFVTIFGPEPDSEYDGRAWKRNEPDFSPTWTAYINKRTRFHRFLDAEAWTDAAMCLVPDDGLHLALVRHLWAEEPDKRWGYAVLTRYRRDDDGGRYFDQEFVADAETPAHALLAACLKAKEQADA